MSKRNVKKTADSEVCVWAQVQSTTPFQEWWTELCESFGWSSDLVIERWSANQSEFSWAKVLDSVNSFTLFKQSKAIIVQELNKLLKQEAEELESLLERFKRGPHRVIFVSEQEAPDLGLKVWKTSKGAAEEEMSDDKATFHWLDAIHVQNLSTAVLQLETAVTAGNHPLALLQILTRDFRNGRLIHHAQDSRMKDSEMASVLKIHPFVIRKWMKRPRFSNSQWAFVFDRLSDADLEMKSGHDSLWVLRKLTFDLVQLKMHGQKTQAAKRADQRQLTLTMQLPPLWTNAPSFA